MGKRLAKLKAAIIELSPLQKAALVFASAVIPPVVVWLQQVGSGADITVAQLALLGSAILGGVLAGIVKILEE